MSSLDNFFAMALFAFATSATPGPVNVISAMSGARYGFIRSLPYVIGATTSFCIILVSIGLGVNIVHEIVMQFSLPLTVIGSAYLIYLAVKIAGADGQVNFNVSEASRPGFATGFITQAINPKAWIV